MTRVVGSSARTSSFPAILVPPNDRYPDFLSLVERRVQELVACGRMGGANHEPEARFIHMKEGA